MKRRGFLQLLGAAPVAIAAPKILAAAEPYVARYTHKTVAIGFGLAPVKAEGALIDYAAGRNGILTRAAFAEEIRQGLNEVFSREYDQIGNEEWKRQFECHPVTFDHHVMERERDFCERCGLSMEEIVDNNEEQHCLGWE